MQAIGRIHRLRRYPVKSMMGADLDQVFVRFSGLTADRVYAFKDPAKQTNFPWVTAREVPEMILFQPKLLNPSPQDKKYPGFDEFKVQVMTPEKQNFAIDDPKFLNFLETRWKRRLELRFSEGGQQDSRPLSILGMSTVEQLEKELKEPIDGLRFRANFYIEWNNKDPLYEDSLLEQVLQIGPKLKIMITKKDKRCSIINLDPSTAQSNPEVLKHVGKNYRGTIGVYAAVLEEGQVSSNDLVYLATAGAGD